MFLQAPRRAAGALGRLAGGIREDLDAAVRRDPATDSRLEMALASPGLHAIWVHASHTPCYLFLVKEDPTGAMVGYQ